MEINHRLFDECSQNFQQEREEEKERLIAKINMWKNIEQKARQNPNVGIIICHVTSKMLKSYC